MGLRCLHTIIFIKATSLEGLPTKAKEDASPNKTRLSPAGHQPHIPWSWGFIIIIITIIIIIIIIIIVITINNFITLEFLSPQLGHRGALLPFHFFITS